MRLLLAATEQFTPADPAYRKVVATRTAGTGALLIVAALVPAVIWGTTQLPWVLLWALVAAAVIAVAVAFWMSLRRAKAIGYVEGAEELLVREGIMFQTVGVIPYGRMQQVNIQTGPLLKRYGLANVELVTAALTSTSKIRGVQIQEAERLREKLTALGQSQMEGL